MRKRTSGKVVLNKLLVALHVTVREGKPSEPVKSTKEITSSSITLDTTGKVVSIMLVHVLLQGMLTGLGNQRDLK